MPNVANSASWENLMSGAYCDYENSPNYRTIYGLSYNWVTVVDPSGLCPVGWHVPSDAEWKIWEEYLGVAGDGDTEIIGPKSREEGTVHWQSPNDATNSSGFTALPGGYRKYNGDFFGNNVVAGWASTTEKDARDSWGRQLYSYSTTFKSY